MSTWSGNSTFSSNYVPQPVPSYTPMGYYRCERCNRLLKDGRECDCIARDAKEEPKAVQVKKYDWHEFRDNTRKRNKNARAKRRDAADNPVLVDGGVRADSGSDSRGPQPEGWRKAMKPCPFCGTKTLDMKKAFGRYKVRCEKCVTVYGPAGYRPEDAMRNWNRRSQ